MSRFNRSQWFGLAIACWAACRADPITSVAQETGNDPISGVWHTTDCSQLDIDIDPDNGLIDGVFRSRTFPRATIRVTGAVIPSRVAMPDDDGSACAATQTPAGPMKSDHDADNPCPHGQYRLPVNAFGRPVALAAKWLPIDASGQERQDYWRWSSLFSGQYFPEHIIHNDQKTRVVTETLDVTVHMYFPDAELTPAQNFPARTLTFTRRQSSHCQPPEPRSVGEAGAFAPVQSGAFVYYGDMWIGDTNPEEYIFGHITDTDTGQIAIYYNNGRRAFSGRGYADVIAPDDGRRRPLPASSFVWTVSTAASAPTMSSPELVKISAAVGSINRAGQQTSTTMTVWEQSVTPTRWLTRAFATRIEEGRVFVLHAR